MRLLRSAATLMAVAAVGTACTAGSTPGAGSGTPADVAANTKAVCADLKKTIAAGGAELLQNSMKAMPAVTTGDDASAALVASLHSGLSTWSAGLHQEAARAADPGLRGALTTYAAQVDKVNSGVRTIADVGQAPLLLRTPELTQAEETLRRSCPDLGASPTG